MKKSDLELWLDVQEELKYEVSTRGCADRRHRQ